MDLDTHNNSFIARRQKWCWGLVLGCVLFVLHNIDQGYIRRTLSMSGTGSTEHVVHYFPWATPMAIDSNHSSSDSYLKSLGVYPRAFPKWNAATLPPCLPSDDKWNSSRVQRSPATEGLLFVKVPKTGSTTGSGLTIRIASNLAKKQHLHFGPNATQVCKNRVQHSNARLMLYSKRDKTKSILWSILREPTSRTVSMAFHFYFSRQERPVTDEEFHTFLRQSGETLTNFKINYLNLWEEPGPNMTTHPLHVINQLVQEYDFLGECRLRRESPLSVQTLSTCLLTSMI